MKKAADKLCILLKGMLIAGFSVQIILGLIWMSLNFIEVQQYGRPEGFLYPLLLRVFGNVPQLLCLLQLGLAGAAGYMLVRPICSEGRLKCIWCVLAFVSLPMAMQCHLALLPHSFVSSLFLLELGCLRRAMECGDGLDLRAMTGAGACWAGLVLLLPEYRWLGLLPIALAVAVRLKRLCGSLRRLILCALLIAAFSGIVAGIGSLTKTEGDYERTFWFAMASRMSWPTIWQDSNGWSQDLRELAMDVCWETSYVPDNMDKVLKPVIEEAVGQAKAQEYYRQIALLAWNHRKTRIARQISWDVLIHGVPQAVLQFQLRGVGYDSCSGRNYEIILMNSPRLAKYYVSYSCWWFFWSMGLAVLLWGARCMAQGLKSAFLKTAFPIVTAVSLAAVVFFYTMQGAGMADYKQTIAAAGMWPLMALWGIGKGKCFEGENDSRLP